MKKRRRTAVPRSVKRGTCLCSVRYPRCYSRLFARLAFFVPEEEIVKSNCNTRIYTCFYMHVNRATAGDGAVVQVEGDHVAGVDDAGDRVVAQRRIDRQDTFKAVVSKAILFMYVSEEMTLRSYNADEVCDGGRATLDMRVRQIQHTERWRVGEEEIYISMLR